MPGWKLVLAILVSFVSTALGTRAEEPVGDPVAESPRERPDILVVTVDTLRRDHVSCYGHESLTTPSLDALAREGVLFSDCQAVTPVTGPSHASIFSGLHPQVHGAFRNGVRIAEQPLLLGELLERLGYRTHAVLAGWTLARAQCGLERGFQGYDDEQMQERVSVVTRMRRAEDVTTRALSWADAELLGAESDPRPPYLLFAHYFDPHEPYESPLTGALPKNPADDGSPPRERHRQRLSDYDLEIAYTDREIGRLLAGLRERGLLDDAVIVVTSDHGQAFGEHDEGGPEGKHGRRVYQSTIAAPLVIAAPGRIPPGRTVDLPVFHLDLFPTLAALAGVPGRLLPAELAGFNLSSILLGESELAPWGSARRKRYALAYRGAVGNKWNPFRFFMNREIDSALPVQYAVVDEGLKVVVDPRKPDRFQVFDLTADPWEWRALKGRERDAHRSLVQDLASWYQRTAGELDTSPLTEEQVEGLRSLGYVGGG